MVKIPIPTHIHRTDDDIAVTWDEQHVSTYTARDLRLRCQCAACRDELTGQPLLDPNTIPADIRAVSVALVGTYAIRIDWSDGHDTGIYSYDYLLSICPCERCASRGA